MSQVGPAVWQTNLGGAWPPREPGAAPPRVRTPQNAADSDATISLTVTRHDLLELNGVVGQSAHAVNALSTAHDALAVIDGLLGNVQAVLTATSSPPDPSFDRESA